jgi:hypothetical protein
LVAALAVVALSALAALAPTPAAAEVVPSDVRAQAIRRLSALAIDGKLDESAWSAAPRHAGFTQRYPKDGAAPSFATRFSILYDDEAVYVGVWADDPEPAKIRRLLTRRDVDSGADSVAVAIDSYYDRRTGYVFTLTAAGVQRDQLFFDDSNADDSWDAVWSGASATGPAGWTAEFRIPLSQLRFATRAVQEWGLQVVRFVGRTQEEASWARWPRSSDETVSKFGVLDGIRGIKPGRRLEVLPYATGGFEARPVEDADPLNDSLAGRGGLGLDVKYGLGSAFTLAATVNPDFGQVEADPSQVNLSANELFFAERRPFFIEGVDLFRIGIGNGSGGAEGVFYSRRIGAAPRSPRGAYRYVRSPTATTIYAAAKLTGKTRSGLSVGWFNAVTAEETAQTIDEEGGEQRPIVAPLTNYAMARLKRDLRGGKTTVGASATAVHRALGGTGLESILHDQAYTAGAQLQHRWSDDAWGLELRTVGSLVRGTPEAVARTQRAPHHLFQRPDARSFAFDPTREQLEGAGATWRVGRYGNTKRWRFMFGGDVRSAELELNDMGFQRNSDRAVPFLWVERHDETPGDYVLQYQVAADVFAVVDELGDGGRLIDGGLECNGSVQLVSRWTFGYGCNLLRTRWRPTALRGGPALRAGGQYNGSLWLNTDTSRRVVVSASAWGAREPESDSIDAGVDAGVTIQVQPNLDVFVGPSYQAGSEAMQYVAEAEDELGRPRYVLARIRQATAAVTMRLNWTFTPTLSLQLYAQPFLATGRYSEYKDVVDAGAARYRDRYVSLEPTLMRGEDGTYTAERDGRFSFARPDFSVREMRSTAVLRWQYRPGSSVFAIWSRGRASSDDDGRFALGRAVRELSRADGEDVVMVKANYWVGL